MLKAKYVAGMLSLVHMCYILSLYMVVSIFSIILLHRITAQENRAFKKSNIKCWTVRWCAAGDEGKPNSRYLQCKKAWQVCSITHVGNKGLFSVLFQRLTLFQLSYFGGLMTVVIHAFFLQEGKEIQIKINSYKIKQTWISCSQLISCACIMKTCKGNKNPAILVVFCTVSNI